MTVCEPVIRSVSVSGSCSYWLPVVEESLRSHGFYNVSVDPRSQRLTAAYTGGTAVVSLYPSAGELSVVIAVYAASYVVGGVL